VARIEKFEDIEARKRGRVLRKPIHERTKAGAFARDFALRGPTELEFKTLQSLAIEISRPTAGLIKYLRIWKCVAQNFDFEL